MVGLEPLHAVSANHRISHPRHAAHVCVAVVERLHCGEVCRAGRRSVHLSDRAVRVGGAHPRADRVGRPCALAGARGEVGAQPGRRHAAARRLSGGCVVGDLRRASRRHRRLVDGRPAAADRAPRRAIARRTRRRRQWIGIVAGFVGIVLVLAPRLAGIDPDALGSVLRTDCRLSRRHGVGDARHLLPEALRADSAICAPAPACNLSARLRSWRRSP